jgi:carbon-monoxide dehydrogenase small subunit
MTATALARRGAKPSREEVREELAGVLCRCTGYDPIVTAVERHLRNGSDG